MGTTKSGARVERIARAAAGVKALGRRVHDLRAGRGLSLQEFATLIGVGVPALSSLERGEATAPLSTLFSAADALEVPMSSLFCEQVADAAPPPRTDESNATPDSEPRGFRSLGEPPADYVPLEMPELWEPDAERRVFAAAERATSAVAPRSTLAAEPLTVAAAEPAPAPPVALTQAGLIEALASILELAPFSPLAVRDPAAAPTPAPVIAEPVAPAREPVLAPQHVAAPESAPSRQYVVASAYAPAAPHPVDPLPPVMTPARAPRTFADLRIGPLEGRTFDSLPQFAVAAVVELGHSVSAIARVFRVPAWKLQGWVEDRATLPAMSKPVAPRR